MSRNWLDWQRVVQELDPEVAIDPVALGCQGIGDYLNLLVTAFREFNGVFFLKSENIPWEILERLEYGVFRKTEFDDKSLGVERFLRMGAGDIAEFATWTSEAKNFLKQALVRPRITLLVVDDAVVIHKLMDRWAKDYSDIEIVGHAFNAEEAERMRKQLNPRVMTLDISMPGKSGLQYLAELMRGSDPSRVILMSAIGREQTKLTEDIFEAGALDYIEKPRLDKFSEMGDALASAIRAASMVDLARVKSSKQIKVGPLDAASGWTPERNMILIGASTGGVEALTEVLTQFPANCPPTLVVQHITDTFAGAFARRLAGLCAAKVVEGADGLQVETGTIYIAPGGLQMGVEARDGLYFLTVRDDPRMNRHKPSVDYLFKAANLLRPRRNFVAALLTGMGRDGANGLLELKQAGSYTIAQDEATSVVWGMPGAAVSAGAANAVTPLDHVARSIFRRLK